MKTIKFDKKNFFRKNRKIETIIEKIIKKYDQTGNDFKIEVEKIFLKTLQTKYDTQAKAISSVIIGKDVITINYDNTIQPAEQPEPEVKENKSNSQKENKNKDKE